MTKDKITDEYIKAVQKQFKHYHAADTRFISDLKDAVISMQRNRILSIMNSLFHSLEIHRNW